MNYRLIFCLILLLAIVGTVSADTLIKYLDENSGDKYMRSASWAAAFSTVRNAAGNVADEGSFNQEPIRVQSSTSATPDLYRYVFRTGYGFNTSAIPDDATIDTVKFTVIGAARNSDLGTTTLGVTGFTPSVFVAFVASDFNKFTDTRYATDIASADFSTNSYNNFTFNAAGISAINKTGYTNFILRTGFDIDNTSPTWVQDRYTDFVVYDSNSGGANRPLLTITYTPAAGGAAPVASFTCTKNFLRIPNSVTCTDSSTNTPTSWSWSMGDGSAAKTTQNVTYQYLKRGIWGITLNATNANGSNVTPSAMNVRVAGYEN